MQTGIDRSEPQFLKQLDNVSAEVTPQGLLVIPMMSFQPPIPVEELFGKSLMLQVFLVEAEEENKAWTPEDDRKDKHRG